MDSQTLRTRFLHAQGRKPIIFGSRGESRARLRLRLEAARHELRCRECRVSWLGWGIRLVGGDL